MRAEDGEEGRSSGGVSMVIFGDIKDRTDSGCEMRRMNRHSSAIQKQSSDDWTLNILGCNSRTSRNGIQGNSFSQQDLPHRASDCRTMLDWLNGLSFLDMPFNTF